MVSFGYSLFSAGFIVYILFNVVPPPVIVYLNEIATSGRIALRAFTNCRSSTASPRALPKAIGCLQWILKLCRRGQKTGSPGIPSRRPWLPARRNAKWLGYSTPGTLSVTSTFNRSSLRNSPSLQRTFLCSCQASFEVSSINSPAYAFRAGLWRRVTVHVMGRYLRVVLTISSSCPTLSVCKWRNSCSRLGHACTRNWNTSSSCLAVE